MYIEVSEKLLKGMRRIMPITRTKFDWSRPNLIWACYLEWWSYNKSIYYIVLEVKYIYKESLVVVLLCGSFTKIWINITWEGSILEGISAPVICRQRVDLQFVHLRIDEVVERSVLPTGFALMPVVNLNETHSCREVFSFYTVDHALMERIARVCLQWHWQHWLYHFEIFIISLLIIAELKH